MSAVAIDFSQKLYAAGFILAKRVQKLHLFLLFALLFSALLTVRFGTRFDPLPELPDFADSGHGYQDPVDGSPKTWQTSTTHPISKLITKSRDEFSATRSMQSQSLQEAVHEYRRRYHFHPPPNFDKWYSFAKENEIPLIDEFDDIYHYLLPFWGLSPRAIRMRGRKASEADEFLMGVFIRNGQIEKIERGDGWKREGFVDALQNFVQYLPDMDIAINLHDEARVVIPHEDLAHLLQTAQKQKVPQASANNSPRNVWTPAPADVNAEFVPNSLSPFNEYAHQFTWTIARLSCPLDSNARILDYDDSPIADQSAAFTEGELGFISNQTAFSDICLSPSLKDTFGFFNRPNAWCVTHELVPIFSPSKPSSFQDILIPAPWYLAEKAKHNETMDPPWEQKRDKLFWRGTTTSGYSVHGTWHRQHRQRFVERVEKPGPGKIMQYEEEAGWVSTDVERDDYKDLFDVHFTFIGQCAPADCEEQETYFDVRRDEDFQLGWQNKYLLDIDGNAFSGRFYAFLQSKSLTFKLALFREWHDRRIKPWVHYVPLSLEGTEHLEALRYFNEEDEGKMLAQEIVLESRQWADESLRHVDMEAWLFRLMLEYGRLVDDNRDVIGFKTP